MKYFYKKRKRVIKISEKSPERAKELIALGYVEVSDKYNPENSIIKIAKPKPKAKPKAEFKSKDKPKVKKEAKKKVDE